MNPSRDGGAPQASPHRGLAGALAAAFIDSKLTPLAIVSSLLLGIAAVLLLPREEEPQIRVPMIDVLVSMPGFSAREVAERATRPMEKLLWELPGVEYVYSTSREGESLVIVRYRVGADPERSLVAVSEKLRDNFDRIPHGVSPPLIKPRSIDDVPVLTLTLHSSRYDALMLRRLAQQLDDSVRQVPNVAETRILGGARRTLRVLLDPVRLASRNLTPAGLVPMLRQANRQFRSGWLTHEDAAVVVETGAFLRSAADVGNVVVGVAQGRPVYLREVADIEDGAGELDQYVLFGRGTAAESPGIEEQPAVTLTVAKRPGANAISVVREVMRRLEPLRGTIIPADVEVTVTRDYAATAAEKSNELLLHMALAVLGVSVLIALSLGWRESVVVAVAIPVTLSLTLLVFYLLGFTLNRITLFALIFSIGILVDDAIVVVENIVRHLRLPSNRGRRPAAVAIEAVSEVGNPTLLATLAVVAAVLPMAFVGGLMGPYMRPIPIGATAAMFWSLLIAFVVTPWASVRVLRALSGGRGGNHAHGAEGGSEDALTRLYRHVMGPLLSHAAWRWGFLAGITILLLAALATVPLGWVRAKMLPFDNKSEFQVILNMPEGSSLERTTQAAREIAAAIRVEPEVTDYQVYAGVAAPYNFNGLVRHYFLREAPHVADVQVNLRPKHERTVQSHEVVRRVRPRVAAIAERYGARVALAEVPPGPPVLQTLVAEVYGPDAGARWRLAERVKTVCRGTPGVVDVDWYAEEPQRKAQFVIDKEKAALHGISAETLSQTLRIAVGGDSVDLVHIPEEKEDVNLVLQLPRTARSSPEELLALRVRSGDANALPEPGTSGAAPLVPLRELVRVKEAVVEQSLYRKNLMPVTYVLGDVSGGAESPAYALFQMNGAFAGSEGAGKSGAVPIYNLSQPKDDSVPAIKWDGEWHITLEVFRDLGLAFAAVLILIYVLMVGWFRSFLTPLIVMAAIPFSLVGILPAHGMMGAFFTATSMIGFMAGAGIVVRNSIILVDFIEQRLAEGMPLEAAVVDAGAVRFRPMLLTALAVVVGAAVILFDPIFQGLAIALMAGEIASLIISRMAVPVLYFMSRRGRETGNSPRLPLEGAGERA
ncbi:MAG: efflux RND transporter permease subunit [Verrucomicrobiota bacterium]